MIFSRLGDKKEDVRGSALQKVASLVQHGEFPWLSTSSCVDLRVGHLHLAAEMIQKVVILLSDKSWKVRQSALQSITVLAESGENYLGHPQ